MQICVLNYSMKADIILLFLLVFEAVHVSQLEEIPLVEIIDAFLGSRIIDLAGSYVSVKDFVSKAEFVLVGHAGEPVARDLLDQH